MPSQIHACCKNTYLLALEFNKAFKREFDFCYLPYMDSAISEIASSINFVNPNVLCFMLAKCIFLVEEQDLYSSRLSSFHIFELEIQGEQKVS